MRLSQGSAATLGLINIKQLVEPTTCYMLLGNRCDNGCAFCAQNVSAGSLSRIDWPEFPDAQVLMKINSSDFKRVCLQCTSVGVGYVKEIASIINLPVSISYNFRSLKEVSKLADAADKICIPLDAANAQIFHDMKNGRFRDRLELIIKAAQQYPGRIATHLIAGLGETEEEMIYLLKHLHLNDVQVGLFAFTPVPHTKLENRKAPDLKYYRRIQAALHEIKHDKVEPRAFETSGCPGCNRPYYNERVSGPIYNYPKQLTEEEYQNAINIR